MSNATRETAGSRASWRSEVTSRFVPLFFTCLALNLAHRVFAVLSYYQSTIRPIYNPLSDAEGARLLWSANGDGLLLGIGGDVLFSALIAIPLSLPFVSNWVRVMVIGGLILFLSANYEHINYNFSHINLETANNALNISFIKGQTTPDLLGLIVKLTVIAVLTNYLASTAVFRRIGGILAIAVVAWAMLAPSELDFNQPVWMQTNPLLPRLSGGSQNSDLRTFSESAVTRTPIGDMAEARHNVLLLYLEGLSTKSLKIGNMETLTRLAEENISFSRYLGNQLVTSNGLYSTLTGDFPYFLSKRHKWSEIEPESAIARNALPVKLRNAGYHTAFLQSAHLDFMDKGEILPRFGFSDLRGAEAWDHSYSQNGWGIDDRALFENTLTYIDGLPEDAPWFISVLTTGTHSPYNVPAEFMPEAPSDRHRALAYLDVAIAVLLDGLRDRGLLENTVVIFTSDESRERSFKNPLQDELLLYWLPMIVRHPTGARHQLDFFIGSQRFPEILATVAGDLDPAALTGLERSNVPFLMGNAFTNRLFWFEQATNTLLSCATPKFDCAVFEGVEDPLTMAASPPSEVANFPNLKSLVEGLETKD